MKFPIMLRSTHDYKMKIKDCKNNSLSKFNYELISENAEYRRKIKQQKEYIKKIEMCMEKLENFNCEFNIKLAVSESKLKK